MSNQDKQLKPDFDHKKCREILEGGGNPYPRLTRSQSKRLVQLLHPFTRYNVGDIYKECNALQRMACDIASDEDIAYIKGLHNESTE